MCRLLGSGTLGVALCTHPRVLSFPVATAAHPLAYEFCNRQAVAQGHVS